MTPPAPPQAPRRRPPVSRETGPGRTGRGPLARAAVAVLLAPVRLYRRLISPLLGPRCRYYPSCSAYAEHAISELGPARGVIVAGWRVLRCNPFSGGGLDPLDERRLFRDRPASDPHSAGSDRIGEVTTR